MKLALFRSTLALVLLFIVGCASAPQKPNSTLGAEWEGKALIKNLKKNESQVVGFFVVAHPKGDARIEISTVMGIQVSSMVLKENQVSILVPNQKTLYSGEAKEGALSKILKTDLNPSLVVPSLYEVEPKTWSCQQADPNKRVCVQKENSIIWEQIEKARRITFLGSGYEVQLQIKSYKAKSELSPKLFQLEAPEGYRTTRL